MDGHPKTRTIYVVLSRTQTRFGRCIRVIARQQYNHASIGLDPALTRLYAYARPRRYALLQGGLVRETLDRYTMGTFRPVPVAVCGIPVTEEDWRWVETVVMTMEDNPEYLYNLYSVLTYPLFHGFPVDRAYSCVEFAAWVLHSLGILEEGKALCSYRPDDLASLLAPYLVYRGDIRGCMRSDGIDRRYFTPMDRPALREGLRALLRITARSLRAAVRPGGLRGTQG